MWFAPAGLAASGTHDASAAPLTHVSTQPVVPEPTPPRAHVAVAAPKVVPARAAPATTTTVAVTGSSSSAATVLPTPAKHPAPAATTCTTTPGRGHHYGWKHRRTPPPARHNGC